MAKLTDLWEPLGFGTFVTLLKFIKNPFAERKKYHFFVVWREVIVIWPNSSESKYVELSEPILFL